MNGWRAGAALILIMDSGYDRLVFGERRMPGQQSSHRFANSGEDEHTNNNGYGISPGLHQSKRNEKGRGQ